MAGKKKSSVKRSRSRGDFTLGESKNVSESNVPRVEENVEKTKIHKKKQRKGADGVIAEAFLSSLDKDSNCDIPQVELKVEKTNNLPRKRRKGADEEMMEAYLSSPDRGTSVLRQRKQIPTFQKIDLSESDYKKIVGKRIKVFWPDSRRWFVGRIDSFDIKKKLHAVLYDDGDEENLNLKNERFELEVVPDDGFTLSYKMENLKKEMASNGGGVHKENKVEKSLKAGVTAGEPEKGSLLLRPRKQIPTFRKVDLSENDYKNIIGKRIKVYWPDSRKWFVGRVNSFDNTKKVHTVFYDDGDTEDLDLQTECFELEVVPNDGFTLYSELGTELKKKKKVTNGGDAPEKTKEEESIKVAATAIELDQGPFSLRPRKQIPSFRKVDLSESDSQKIVGKRIKVYWPDSRKWFVGRINSYDTKKKLHAVYYDDGDEENLNLNNERFELEVVPDDGYFLCAEMGSNSKGKKTEEDAKLTIEAPIGRKVAPKTAKRSSKLQANDDTVADEGENLVMDVKMNNLPKKILKNLNNSNTRVKPGDSKSETSHNETEMLRKRSSRKNNGVSIAIQVAEPSRHIEGENGETLIKEKQEPLSSELTLDKAKEMKSAEDNSLAGVYQTDTQVADSEISEAETLQQFLKNCVKKRQVTVKKKYY